jgi:hypothetical protein
MKTEGNQMVHLGSSLETGQGTDVNPRWNLATRIGFRFAFIYLGLYTLTFPAGGFIPYTDFLVDWSYRFWAFIIPLISKHVLHLSEPVALSFTGSSDKLYDWVQLLCIFVFSVVGTVVWALLDRKRENYIQLHKWFRIWIRFALASTMIQYGAMKLIPNQMDMTFYRLLEPFGHASPMGMLWAFMGASTGYEIFTGCVEVLGGILLVIPWIASLGAFVTLAATIQVFTLNMFFKVPVKIFSFHPILLSVFLIASDVSRLIKMLVLNRKTEPVVTPPLFRKKWLNWTAVALQAALGVYLVFVYLNYNIQSYKRDDGAPKPPLYGIWQVDDFELDGETRPPLLTDPVRWRRVMFEDPNDFVFQRMDDKLRDFSLQLDDQKKTMTLGKRNDENWKAQLNFDHPASNRLMLQGEFDGHRIQVQLTQMDPSEFPLIHSDFHWIQEHPTNDELFKYSSQ